MANGIDPQTLAAIQSLIGNSQGATQPPGAGQQMYPTGQPNWAARGGSIFGNVLQQQAANNQKQALTQAPAQGAPAGPVQQLAPNPAQGPAISPNVQTAPQGVGQAPGAVSTQPGEFKRIPLAYPEVNNLPGVLGESWDNLRNEKIEQQRDSQDRTYELQKRSFEQQQAQAQAQAAKMKLAQDQRQSILQAALSSPAAFQSPQIQAALAANNEALGIPTVYDKDGKMDRSQFLPNIKDADDKTKAAFFGAAPGPAKDAYAQQFSGITPEMLSAGPVLSTKDQVAIGKLELAGLSESDRNNIAQRKLTFQSELTQAQHDLDYAKIGSLQAQAAKAESEVQINGQKLKEMPTRLAIDKQRADAMLMSATRRAGAGGMTQLKQDQATARQVTQNYNAAYNDYKAAQVALGNYTATHMDPDDPITAQMTQMVADAKNALDSLQTSKDQADAFIKSEAASLSAGNQASGTTGKNISFSSAGGGSQQVQRATSKSGKPIISRDGGKTWEYGS